MNNYEAYLSFKKTADSAIVAIHYALGRTDTGEYNSQNDKHTLIISTGEMGYGYYGSSSYYTSDNKTAKDFLNRACKEFTRQIADKAIELLKKECETLRKAAVQEAHTVLQDTKVSI